MFLKQYYLNCLAHVQQQGVTRVIELASGIAAWERAGLPLRRSATAF